MPSSSGPMPPSRSVVTAPAGTARIRSSAAEQTVAAARRSGERCGLHANLPASAGRLRNLRPSIAGGLGVLLLEVLQPAAARERERRPVEDQAEGQDDEDPGQDRPAEPGDDEAAEARDDRHHDARAAPAPEHPARLPRMLGPIIPFGALVL